MKLTSDQSGILHKPIALACMGICLFICVFSAIGLIAFSVLSTARELPQRVVAIQSPMANAAETVARVIPNSPETAVGNWLKAIERQDANAYLDALDPMLRDQPNYFSGSTIGRGITALLGLGSGIDLTKVSFRDLTMRTESNDGKVARVTVSGKVRNLAMATEQDFSGVFVTRSIGGTWYVSDQATVNATVYAPTIEAIAQATRQTIDSKCRAFPTTIKLEPASPVRYEYKQDTWSGPWTVGISVQVRVSNNDNQVHSIKASTTLFTNSPSSPNETRAATFEADLPPKNTQTLNVVFRDSYPGKLTSQELTFSLLQVDDYSYAYARDPKRGNSLQSPVSCKSLGTTITLRNLRRDARLFGIRMLSAEEGWIRTDSDFVLHLKNGIWEEVSTPGRSDSANIRSIFPTAPNEMWASTRGGDIYHYLNGNWEKAKTPVTGAWDLYMNSAREGWAVANQTTMHFIDGSWLRVQNPLTSSYRSLENIEMITPDEGWAVGSGGLILHFAGGQWSVVAEPRVSYDLTSVHPVSKNDVWAVGTEGTILHYDGKTWSPVKSPTTDRLQAVHMVSDKEGWAVGGNSGLGLILHFQNGKWEQIQKQPLNIVNGIDMVSPKEGWAVSAHNEILHYQNGIWNEYD